MTGLVPTRLAAVWALLLTAKSHACSIVAVGKDASASGYPMVSHTDDSDDATSDVRLVRVAARDWPEGSRRPLYAWQDGYPRVVSRYFGPDYEPVKEQKVFDPLGWLPQVKHTFAYWDLDYGAMNEKGVAIGESTCTAKTVGWQASADTPWGFNRVGIEELTKIALERCSTARCALQTMGDIAVEMGFYAADIGPPDAPEYDGTGEALVVVDTEEVWIFNLLTGRNNASAIWAAERIPANHVAAVANTFTITRMNLTDNENFLYSPGVTDLAVEQGWWKPEDSEPGLFNFFQAYGWEPASGGADAISAQNEHYKLKFYSGRRQWRIFSKLAPEEGKKLDPNQGNLPHMKNPYPGSVPATPGSISARMIMDLQRDHYEGTPYDLTAGMAAGPFGNPNRGASAASSILGSWERAMSMHRTTYSFVNEARPNGRGVMWLGLDMPHGTAYLPFFSGATKGAPESFHSHDGCMSKFSQKVAWWAFNMVNQHTDVMFNVINPEVRKKAQQVEDAAEKRVAFCIGEAEKRAHGEQSLDLLTKCSNDFAQSIVDDWWEFGFSLLAKFGRYRVTINESSSGTTFVEYPEWWLRSLEVGYSSWTERGPYHGVLVLDSFASLPSLPLELSATFDGQVFMLVLSVACIAAIGGFQLGLWHQRRVSEKVEESYRFMSA